MFSFWQRNQEKPSTAPEMPYIEAPHGEKRVDLRSLEIMARVKGLYAETTQTMRFYNPNSRDLEGNLIFSLPGSLNSAPIYGFSTKVP